jgi:predicted transcriptional regulator of viral defense system
MRYDEFRAIYERRPVFRTSSFVHLKNPKNIKDRITEWVEAGKVIRLKRGLYTLRDEDRLKNYSNYFFSNQIYSPSYVSLEAALQYYGFIPEAVRTITAVTTKKTCDFENKLGWFVYYHIKTELFKGITKEKDIFGNEFLIASREKALLDLIYFKTSSYRKITRGLLEDGYRLQWLDSVDISKLYEMAELYDSKKITEAAKVLADYIQEEWQ